VLSPDAPAAKDDGLALVLEIHDNQSYSSIVLINHQALCSVNEGHGLMKPFPPLTWCFSSSASSGCFPSSCDADMTEAYRTAAVEADAIFVLVWNWE
jgi:hypothetical protein